MITTSAKTSRGDLELIDALGDPLGVGIVVALVVAPFTSEAALPELAAGEAGGAPWRRRGPS